MNLQRLIDQHPSVFAAIFPIYFLFLFFFAPAISSFIGGWFSLAKIYRTRALFSGTKWRRQSGQMRWRTHYPNMMTIGSNREGLYLAMMLPFRFMHPPLLVPWSEITARESKAGSLST